MKGSMIAAILTAMKPLSANKRINRFRGLPLLVVKAITEITIAKRTTAAKNPSSLREDMTQSEQQINKTISK